MQRFLCALVRILLPVLPRVGHFRDAAPIDFLAISIPPFNDYDYLRLRLFFSLAPHFPPLLRGARLPTFLHPLFVAMIFLRNLNMNLLLERLFHAGSECLQFASLAPLGRPLELRSLC